MISKNLIDKLGGLLAEMPAIWEGKKAILEMKPGHIRQFLQNFGCAYYSYHYEINKVANKI